MPGMSADAVGETVMAVSPLGVTAKEISFSERFPRTASQPFEPPTFITPSATRAGTGVEVATALLRAEHEPAEPIISPAAPGAEPPKASRSIFTRIGKSHRKGSEGAKAETRDAEALPLRSVMTIPPVRQAARPVSSVSAPLTARCVANERLARDASGAQRHRTACPWDSAASPLQTVPDAASQIPEPSARSSSRRAGNVAINMNAYANIPARANKRKRRLLTARGGAI